MKKIDPMLDEVRNKLYSGLNGNHDESRVVEYGWTSIDEALINSIKRQQGKRRCLNH